MKPFQNNKATHYEISMTEQGGTVQFHDGSVRAEHLTATDPSIYMQVMVEGLDEHLNGTGWEQAAVEAIPSEIRPAGASASGQQVAILADRSVTFDPRVAYDGTKVEKGAAMAGDFIFTEAADRAVLLSHRVTVLDHVIQAGFTESSMEQTAEKLLEDILMDASGKVAKVLSDSPSTVMVAVGALTGKPSAKAEYIIDAIVEHIDQAVGTEINDFTVLIHKSLIAILDLSAQRSGHKDAEEMLGTVIQGYSGEDLGLFLIPRRFTSLSYRRGSNGDVWKIMATRNPAIQGYDLEVMAVVDVVCKAFVRVKVGADLLGTETVSFPLITRLTFEAP